jgi:hypothetical protein
MTTSPSPSYYFSGIGFNSLFYNTPSSYLTTTQAKSIFLQKKVPDVATAQEFFLGGIATDSIAVTGVLGSLSIGTNALTQGVTMGSNNTTGNIAMGNSLTTGNLNFGNSAATGSIYFNSPNIFAFPISMNYIAANAPSNQTHLGYTPFSFNPTGKVSSTAITTGSTAIYTQSTQITAVGTYLMTMTGILVNQGGNTAGTVSSVGFGYSYGANLNPSLNTVTNIYVNISPYTFGNAGNRDNVVSFTYPLFISSNVNYLAGYAAFTVGTAMTPGTAQIVIDNWSITRIG